MSRSPSSAPQPGRRRPRPVSPLTLRILAVNLFALLALGGAILFLGRYRDRLVEGALAAVRREAAMLAGALAEGAWTLEVDPVTGDSTGRQILVPEVAAPMTRALSVAPDTRALLFDAQGVAIRDPAEGPRRADPLRVEALPPPGPFGLPAGFLSGTVSRVIASLPGGIAFPPQPPATDDFAAAWPDARAALTTGATLASGWRGPDREVLLTAAAPVTRGGVRMGAVLVVRRGTELEQAVASVRADILSVLAGVFFVSLTLSAWLSRGIVVPLKRLRDGAERVRGGSAGSDAIPDLSGRGDEIGELGVALRDMTEALSSRLVANESFAADVAHEIKNPLTSLRSAVETASRLGDDPDRQRRLMAIIEHDVRRLDRLITDISDASRLDAELGRARAEPVDLAAMLGGLSAAHASECVEGPAGPDGPPSLRVEFPEGPLVVPGIESRLGQVFENLITNALSFSPPCGEVRITGRRLGPRVEVLVEDDGPGIPDGKFEAIFARFYSERPAGEQFGRHSGLGLSIARQIVEAHGGTISAANRVDETGRVRGALFRVTLPGG